MAERDVVQNLIAALGCSQAERDAPALAPTSAPVHASDAAALLARAHALAARLRHHAAGADPAMAPDWTPFFPPLTEPEARALIERSDGQVTPHLALYAAFLRLFDRHARGTLNRFTADHLDFQWRRVLGFVPRPLQGGHALVQVTLKKGAPAPLALGRDLVFLAGKDTNGVERRWRPVRETFVSHARVAGLRALHRAPDGRVFAAPAVDSADGLGSPLPPAAPSWHAFAPAAGTSWPAAGLGFAVASPLLALAEGEREIELQLRLADALPAPLAARLRHAFEARTTAPKGWSDALPAPAEAQGATQIVVRVRLAPDAPPVVAADPARHGAPWRSTSQPVLRLTLADGASIDGLDRLQILGATLAVRVRGVSAGLALENDAGALDPKRAFLPFGAVPVRGARFMVGCPEALGKPLVSLALRLAWQGAPDNLAAHYARYRQASALDNGVTATLIFQDAQGRTTRRVLDLMARDADGVSTLRPDSPPPAPSTAPWRDLALVAGLERRAHPAGKRLAHGLRSRFGIVSTVVAPAQARRGVLTVQLNEDFLHADWRRESVAALLADPKNPLPEPYTPTVASIALDYEARAPEAPLAPRDDEAAESESFIDAPLQFFHVGAFGARREHPWVRRHRPGRLREVTLLPRAAHEGELFIGVAGIGAGDPLSLLVQVAAGSADPELAPPALEWSVLADDDWLPLGPESIAHEGTRGLLDSGTVALALPAETGTDHDWMPGGLVWLRVAAPRDTRATCALLALAANGVELAFDAQPGNAADTKALPAGSIAKLAAPPLALKSVEQPFASFGGRAAESAEALSRRAAERLRHRARALCAWDVERLVLEAFPGLHRVKCLPHARGGDAWLAPGGFTVVVVPRVGDDIAGAADRLRPRADLGTLDAVRDFLQRRAALGARVRVCNAFFEPLRVGLKLGPRAGVAFNPLRARVDERLRRALAPWAFEPAREIAFGGQVFRSALLALVEDEPGVDFVTEFSLRAQDADGRWGPDSAVLQASRPDAVLVSAPSHAIEEA